MMQTTTQSYATAQAQIDAGALGARQIALLVAAAIVGAPRPRSTVMVTRDGEALDFTGPVPQRYAGALWRDLPPEIAEPTRRLAQRPGAPFSAVPRDAYQVVRDHLAQSQELGQLIAAGRAAGVQIVGKA